MIAMASLTFRPHFHGYFVLDLDCYYHDESRFVVCFIPVQIPLRVSQYRQSRKWVRVPAFLSLIRVVLETPFSLVLGIIVDTFSQLREEQAHRDEEMTSKCFICSLPAYRFEKFGGFKKHIAQDHNMWMYLYCTIYLDDMARADRTDLQAFLYDQWVENKNHGPFPIMRAQVLEQSDRDTGDMVQGLMSKLTALEEANRVTQRNIGYMSSTLRDKIDELRGDGRGDGSSSAAGTLSPVRNAGRERSRGENRLTTSVDAQPEFGGFAGL